MTNKTTLPSGNINGFLACLVDAADRLGPITEAGFSSESATDVTVTRPQHESATAVVSDEDESKTNSTTRKKSKALPLILMELLLEPSYSDVLTFLPDGESFAVLSPERFELNIMKDHFKVIRFATFERKLEMWGFRRDSDGTRNGSRTFRHPKFRRGDWDACRKIRCKKRTNSLIYTAVPAMPITVSPATPVSSRGPLPVPGECRRLRTPQDIVGPSSSLSLSSSCSNSRDNSQRNSPASPLCQSAVDNVTRQVMGAALGVLMHDKVRTQQHRMQQRRHGLKNPMTMNSGLMPSTSLLTQLQTKLFLQQQRRQAMRGMLFQR